MLAATFVRVSWQRWSSTCSRWASTAAHAWLAAHCCCTSSDGDSISATAADYDAGHPPPAKGIHKRGRRVAVDAAGSRPLPAAQEPPRDAGSQVSRRAAANRERTEVFRFFLSG